MVRDAPLIVRVPPMRVGPAFTDVKAGRQGRRSL